MARLKELADCQNGNWEPPGIISRHIIRMPNELPVLILETDEALQGLLRVVLRGGGARSKAVHSAADFFATFNSTILRCCGASSS